MASGTSAAQERAAQNRRIAVVAAAVAVTVALTVAGVVAASMLTGGSKTPGGPRAAIIDQLALTDPNAQFVADATRELESAGYTVDYVPAQSVTVEFYRTLPARGYRFIVLRSHTSNYRTLLDAAAASKTPDASIGLFTNEVYSTKTHVEDQRARRLMIDSYVDRNIPWRYFGITPEFILNSTSGRFSGTTVVLMGCSGLERNDLAQAFLARGAKDFVSWDRPVTAKHTDAATSELLANLFSRGMDLRQAVAKTMDDVGSDPAYGARLAVLP